MNVDKYLIEVCSGRGKNTSWHAKPKRKTKIKHNITHHKVLKQGNLTLRPGQTCVPGQNA